MFWIQIWCLGENDLYTFIFHVCHWHSRHRGRTLNVDQHALFTEGENLGLTPSEGELQTISFFYLDCMIWISNHWHITCESVALWYSLSVALW